MRWSRVVLTLLLSAACFLGAIQLVAYARAPFYALLGDTLDERSRHVAENAIHVATFFALLSVFALIGSVVMSRGNTREFLAWKPSHLTWPESIACAVGALFAAYLGYLIREPLFGAASEHTQSFHRLLAGAPSLAASLALMAAISIGPAIGEELLFRGLLLRGTEVEFSPVPAIAITTIAFAAVHTDPQHIVTVSGIGLWITLVAWRADSLWPCIGAHALNNAVFSVLVYNGWGGFDRLAPVVHGLAWAIALPAFLYALKRVVLRKPLIPVES